MSLALLSHYICLSITIGDKLYSCLQLRVKFHTYLLQYSYACTYYESSGSQRTSSNPPSHKVANPHALIWHPTLDLACIIIICSFTIPYGGLNLYSWSINYILRALWQKKVNQLVMNRNNILNYYALNFSTYFLCMTKPYHQCFRRF